MPHEVQRLLCVELSAWEWTPMGRCSVDVACLVTGHDTLVSHAFSFDTSYDS